ncbi:MAG: hypothetical protein ACREBD_35285 [Blastocatellia bacterium]
MKSDLHNERLMVRYLLGELPESEVERLDEQSFADDDFFRRLQTVENDLIDAYARGEMAPGEREQFERHFLTTPKRRERAAFAEALAAFRFEQPTNDPAGAAQTERISLWQSFINFFRVPRPTLQFSLAAASVVLLLGAAWLIVETARLRSRLTQIEQQQAALTRREQELQAQVAEQRVDRDQLAEELRRVQEQRDQLERELAGLKPAEPNFALFVLSPGVRGPGGGPKDFTLPPGAQTVKLRVEFESDPYPSYRAELRTQAGDQQVWSGGKLRARAEGGIKIINLSLRASLFQPQGYLLNLKGVAANGEITDIRSYQFRVVKK